MSIACSTKNNIIDEETNIENNVPKNKRSSNFELLRIILILMIITLHYLNKTMGGALNTKNILPGETNYYLARIIESACIIAVNCFVLITGYFMHDKKKIKIGKVINLFFILCFYNIIIYILNIVFCNAEFSKETLITFLETFTTGGPWFLYIYLILYLLIPYINLVINNSNKKQMRILITVLVVFFYLWPTFVSNVTVKDNGYGIINFITLYMIGSYLRLYKKENKKKDIIINILMYFFMTIITFVFSVKKSTGAFNYNSIFNIISAISFFLIFKDLKFKSKIINNLAKYTFGIYIIHVNTFMIPIIWEKLLNTKMFYKSNFFILHLLGSVAIVYLICIILDFIREKIFKNLLNKLLNKTRLYNYEIKVE